MYPDRLRQALSRIEMGPFAHLFERVKQVRESKRTVWVCGNGGSFSCAQHWASDLLKAGKVRAIALGSNPSLFSASSNDLGYERGFSLEFGSFVDPGDILICLSCSGRSSNILETLSVASNKGVDRFLISGLKAPVYSNVQQLTVPSDEFEVIEDCFSMIGHWLTIFLRERR